MNSISPQDLKTDPDALLDRVEAGECSIVTRGGGPAAEIRPLAPAIRGPRPIGLAAGEFTVPDDFDDPLPDDLLRAFEG